MQDRIELDEKYYFTENDQKGSSLMILLRKEKN